MRGQTLAPLFLKPLTALYEFTKKWTDIFLSYFYFNFPEGNKSTAVFFEKGFYYSAKVDRSHAVISANRFLGSCYSTTKGQ